MPAFLLKALSGPTDNFSAHSALIFLVSTAIAALAAKCTESAPVDPRAADLLPPPLPPPPFHARCAHWGCVQQPESWAAGSTGLGHAAEAAPPEMSKLPLPNPCCPTPAAAFGHLPPWPRSPPKTAPPSGPTQRSRTVGMQRACDRSSQLQALTHSRSIVQSTHRCRRQADAHAQQ